MYEIIEIIIFYLKDKNNEIIENSYTKKKILMIIKLLILTINPLCITLFSFPSCSVPSHEQIEVLSFVAYEQRLIVATGSVWAEHGTFIYVYEQTWTWSALWRIDSVAKSTSIVETRRLNYGPNNFRLDVTGKLYRDWLLDDVSCRINLLVFSLNTRFNRSRFKVD